MNIIFDQDMPISSLENREGFSHMVYLVRHEQCPNCFSTHLFRLKRKSWMRRIRRSRFYECLDCRCLFLCAEELFRVAAVTALLGVVIFSLVFFADDFGFGDPGRGVMELAGLMIGICLFLLGIGGMTAFSIRPGWSYAVSKPASAAKLHSTVSRPLRVNGRGTRSQGWE
jgi:hypothetical protein